MNHIFFRCAKFKSCTHEKPLVLLKIIILLIIISQSNTFDNRSSSDIADKNQGINLR